MKETTQLQSDVLSFIASFKKKHTYSPTVREIAAHFHVSAKAAQDHIVELKRKGLLSSNGKLPRTLFIPEGVLLYD
jgi:repressor LexA